MTMEVRSTCQKENLAALGSEAYAREKALEFTQLYAKFRRRIYYHIYRLLGNQEDADDVTQEVFVIAYLTWDDLYAHDNLYAWLYRTATNSCIDLLRRRKRISWWSQEHPVGIRDEDDTCWLSDSGGIPEIAEREHIQRTFSHLPKGYAFPLLLSASRGMSYREIAVIAGISPNAAATRLTRARKLFAEAYQRLGSDSVE